LSVEKLHERCINLPNGGHSHSKGRVSKKHGVRSAEHSIPHRNQDGDCKEVSGPTTQQTPMSAVQNFLQQNSSACSVARIKLNTLFFSCCESIASPHGPQATVLAPPWVPRLRTCDRRYAQRLHLAEGTSPRGLRCLCAHKGGKNYSAPLLICRVLFS
jgi:hypothetical protein